MSSRPDRVGFGQRLTVCVPVLTYAWQADLHRHLDGAVRVSTIIELAREQGVALPTMDADELRRIVTVSNDCPSLEVYLRGFGITCSVLQKAYALTRVMFEVCEDAVRDGLQYVEVRFSPVLHVNEDMGLSQVMEAVCEGKDMAEYHLPICARIIICGLRHLPPKTTMALAQVAYRYRNRGVVAFDLAGPESGFSSVKHKEAFDVVRERLLKLTIHSGEAAGPDSIMDSIRYCGAHRIGHGVTLGQDTALLQFVVDRRIPLECCPTSNLQTKAVQSLAEHPMRAYFDQDVLVTVNTDNPTVSGVTLSSELVVCQNEIGFQLEELVRLIDNAFRVTFLERGARNRMRAEALYKTVAILRSEGFDVSGIVSDFHYYDAGVNFDLTLSDRFWGGLVQPEPTAGLIRLLPKADLHVRFDGSQSLEFVLTELCASGVDARDVFGVSIGSLDELRAIIQPEVHTDETMVLSKQVLNFVLQTESQLVRGLRNVYEGMAADNVVYFELALNPASHTEAGLSVEQVTAIILRERAVLDREFGVESGVILCCSTTPTRTSNPVIFHKIVELTIGLIDNGVVGFGVFGHVDMPQEAYTYYANSFDLLSKHSIKVSICAGTATSESVVWALTHGSASRISGGFKAHASPALVSHLSEQMIPLELALSDKLRQHTKEVASFASSPIELFLDSHVPVAVCSFRRALYKHTLSDKVCDVARSCKLDISRLISLLSKSFIGAFLPYNRRMQLLRAFYDRTREIATAHGFRYLRLLHYIRVPEETRGQYEYGVFDANRPRSRRE